MKQILYDVCDWLAGVLDDFCNWLIPPLKTEETPFYKRAKELVTAANSFKSSGEYKRHKVYAQLLKEFPMVRHRDVGYLIELILQEETKNVDVSRT